MIFKEHLDNNNHLIYRVSLLLYLYEVEFIEDFIIAIFKDYGDEKKSIKIVNEILEYSILTDKIVIIDIFNKKHYNKSNYKEFLKLLEENFCDFLDIKNIDYTLKYGIEYTKSWKKELAKIGLWNREILKN